ncbi:hypothetical protein D8B23_12775 [Verminephrobacter aporrectodeae subsp. tuberculatae]|uniref:hypothetical protein n=1 Tax=Verminephrobacter aporrectodeae TaxID=1110389 RepID=UPI002243F341|nr:hypothetical protein [Verminephrobacter aporrectodeae]MCW8199273.1 hypothetical protein [Verminephrobacter aporrectodeae subsp. tuberculatae]MCW8207656.1 hypothetical protein [Verminephrobacter aporrectodeae subsp. tuberculatae]
MPVTKTLPSLGITDKAFRYRNAASTDIRKTFARVKRQQATLLSARAQQTTTVVPLTMATRSGK